MSSKVFLLECPVDNSNQSLLDAFKENLISGEYLSFIDEKDFVAVKTHFGESKKNGHVGPEFLDVIGKLIKNRGGIPFLTETSTLYRGNRTNAIDHIMHANRQGFTIENTGMPVIMSDGLMGDEEAEIEINGKYYKSVPIASLVSKVQSLVVVSHFTGHIVSGFGGALKNIGMGLSSRRGKMIQHSTSKPKIKKKLCTACGECIRWCPSNAISYVDGKAYINKKICIGCAECLAVCRFDAVGYNWSESYENLQKKIVEHAMGVVKTKKGKIIFINFLTKISKDCDCMGSFERISSDIGILISNDPVALDSASLDIIEERLGRKLSKAAHDIPYRVQREYSKELGFGNTDYELIKVKN